MSTATNNSKSRTANDVLWYIPNLIGYVRVILTITSIVLLILLPDVWKTALVLYFAAFVGDLIDGMAARRYNQCSQFGGVLDMITDRCATLGLLFVLAVQAPTPILQLVYAGLAILDISSHWLQMHSTLLTGQHHKSDHGNEGRHFLVRWFYKYYWFFGYLCVGAELFYVLSLALGQWQNSDNLKNSNLEQFLYNIARLVWMVSMPGCILKQFVNLSQLFSACYAIAQLDAEAFNKNNNNNKAQKDR